AMITTAYGSPDVLQKQEVAKPTPKDNEVLIAVRAASVTPSDSAFRKGEPFIVRLLYGLRKPRLSIGGVEFAGDVTAVGSAVTSFKVGDAVFGMSPDHFGAHAEYMTLAENKPMIGKPAHLAYEDAVAITDGATTALTFLRNVAQIKPGQKVLINGASGAVGAAAVQLTKQFGAEVTGVCSTANVALVKSLGADHVIDYTREDFTHQRGRYDVIYDAVGKNSFKRCKRALTKKGIYMTTVPTLGVMFQMLWTGLFGGKKVKFTPAGLKQNKENLIFLAGLVEAGSLRPVIDRCYPLEALAEAQRYVETGKKKGNVIVTVVA
ncbi:MAG TPA: NAD(P)-dependent alcohol dehydrogenase, partial [Aggregatilineales bacterium]|nr:NAD(P)-dependent alcohol dehydrogenase [Aggregatilineales bacterium]